jgi:hypothetical protein
MLVRIDRTNNRTTYMKQVRSHRDQNLHVTRRGGGECRGCDTERSLTVSRMTLWECTVQYEVHDNIPRNYGQHARSTLSRSTSGCRDAGVALHHGPSRLPWRLKDRVKQCACNAVGHVELRTALVNIIWDIALQPHGAKSGSIPFGPHWLERVNEC